VIWILQPIFPNILDFYVELMGMQKKSPQNPPRVNTTPNPPVFAGTL
jgi:hypothetical protein